MFGPVRNILKRTNRQAQPGIACEVETPKTAPLTLTPMPAIKLASDTTTAAVTAARPRRKISQQEEQFNRDIATKCVQVANILQQDLDYIKKGHTALEINLKGTTISPVALNLGLSDELSRRGIPGSLRVQLVKGKTYLLYSKNRPPA